eukprot:3368154-Rhodomonas_salina.5
MGYGDSTPPSISATPRQTKRGKKEDWESAVQDLHGDRADRRVEVEHACSSIRYVSTGHRVAALCTHRVGRAFEARMQRAGTTYGAPTHQACNAYAAQRQHALGVWRRIPPSSAPSQSATSLALAMAVDIPRKRTCEEVCAEM